MADDSPDAPLRIIVVDDHPMLREGVVAILERQDDMSVVGEGRDGEEALALFAELNPDVVLIDIQMPGMGGIEAISRIKATAPEAAVIVLTTYPGDTQALRALKAGASGYLLKSCIRKDLIDTIRSVHRGRRIVAPEVAQEIALHAGDETLTERERTILGQIASGGANKEIARRLGVSPDTIKADLKNIFSKLDVEDRTHAVVVALKRGLIEI